MHLNLYIGSKLLSSVPLDPARLGSETYLQSLRNKLLSRYQQLIALSNQLPSCCIEDISSSALSRCRSFHVI